MNGTRPTSAKHASVLGAALAAVVAVLAGYVTAVGPVGRFLLPFLIAGSGIVFVKVRRSHGAELISPAVLCAVAWIVSITIGQMDFWTNSSNQTESWTVSTWVLLVGAVMAFAVGCQLASGGSGVRLDRVQCRQTLRDSVNWRIANCATAGMYLLGFAAYAVFSLRFRAITGSAAPLFTENTARDRLYFKAELWGYASALLVPAVILSLISYVIVGPRRIQKVFLVLVPIAILTMMSAGVRSDSFRAVIAGAIAMSLIQAVRRRLVLASVVAIVVVFSIVNVARLGSDAAQSRRRNLPQQITTIHNQELATLYLYVGTPHNNFQTLTESQSPRKSGAIMARSVLNVVGLERYTEVDYPANWDIGNTMTWAGSYYLDFGPAGVLGIPLALGLLVGALFRRLSERPTFGKAVAYSIFAEAIILSPSTERFFESSTVFILGVTSVVAWLATKKYRPEAPVPSSAHLTYRAALAATPVRAGSG